MLLAVAEQHFSPGYSEDPVRWSKERLGIRFWSKQEEVTRAVAAHRYVAVHSCHDGGKSFAAACLTCWWTDTRPPGESFVTTTAPTAPQVSAILWREIEKLHRRGKLKGRIGVGTQPEWKIDKELVAYGRKPADYDESGFQGVHARYPLIIVDEAGGIPKQLWDAIDALATNLNARVLAIGNPDDPNSHFATLCKPGSGWHVIHIDGLRTPNFTEEAVKPYPLLYQYMVEHGVPFSTEPVSRHVAESLLAVHWVWERMARWGVSRKDDATWSTSPLWESKVRGNFADTKASGVIPHAWVQAAVQRWYRYAEGNKRALGKTVYGVDVAREGDDDTCVAELIGDVVTKIYRWSKKDTMETADRVHALLGAREGSMAWVDVIGVGAGPYDRLKQLRDNVKPYDVTRRTDMMDETRTFTFQNVYSAAWWLLREALDPQGNPTLCLPDDDLLIADLTAPGWQVLTGSVIKVEPKEMVKKRLKRSPDAGDAVVSVNWNGGRRKRGTIEFAETYGGDSEFAFEWDDAVTAADGW